MHADKGGSTPTGPESKSQAMPGGKRHARRSDHQESAETFLPNRSPKEDPHAPSLLSSRLDPRVDCSTPSWPCTGRSSGPRGFGSKMSVLPGKNRLLSFAKWFSL